MVALSDIQNFELFIKSHWTVQARDKTFPIAYALNAPQRIVEYERQKLVESRRLVRMKLLKMRQGGLSTYCTALVQHFTSTKRGMVGFSIADKKNLPAHWLDRAKQWYTQTPAPLRPVIGKSNANEMLFPKLGSTYMIGSQLGQTPAMGFTTHALHLSELSDWRDPKKIMDDMLPGVPKDNPDAFIILESTGWMVGTWWHDQCMLTLDGGDDFVLVFLPWFIMENYSKPPIGVEVDFTEKDYTDEEQEAVEIARRWMIEHPDHAYLAGFNVLTLEHMAWRRWTIRNEFSGDLARFKSKYPATPAEAFLATGSLALPLEIVLHHKSTIDTQVDGQGNHQPKRFVKLSRNLDGKVEMFGCNPNDRLAWTIYQDVREFCEYAVGGDPAEGTLSDKGDERSDRDCSAGAVMNRRTLEFVAEFNTQQIASDLFGEQLKMISEYYNMAYLGAEFNNNGQATIGPCKHYPNMLMRTGEDDDINSRDIRKLWWKNTQSSRKEMITNWISGCRKKGGEGWDSSITVYSPILSRQEETFIENPAGKAEHRKGCHDDLLFAYMIAYWTHCHTEHRRRSPIDNTSLSNGRLDMAFAGGIDTCEDVIDD